MARPTTGTHHCDADLAVGGAFSSRMEAKDGSMGFDFADLHQSREAQIDRVLLRRSNAQSSSATTRTASSTRHFESESTNPIEQQRDGWQAILNNFKRYVENVVLVAIQR